MGQLFSNNAKALLYSQHRRRGSLASGQLVQGHATRFTWCNRDRLRAQPLGWLGGDEQPVARAGWDDCNCICCGVGVQRSRDGDGYAVTANGIQFVRWRGWGRSVPGWAWGDCVCIRSNATTKLDDAFPRRHPPTIRPIRSPCRLDARYQRQR